MRISGAPVPVLLHGYLGFNRIGPVSYFRGVQKMLRNDGVQALVPQVPATGSIAERAGELSKILSRHPAPCFALLGHSFGGLDARYVASQLDPEHRVQVVMTVSTPHRGTPVAGWLRDKLAQSPKLRRLLGPLFGNGLRDLDQAVRAAEPIPDRDDVSYISFATVRPLEELCLPLRLFGRKIDGPNDGLVPVGSAPWGKFCGKLRADHFEVVGWSLSPSDPRAVRPFAHLPFWREAVRQAVAAGSCSAELV
jgi:triacylglycerol lipase